MWIRNKYQSTNSTKLKHSIFKIFYKNLEQKTDGKTIINQEALVETET